MVKKAEMPKAEAQRLVKEIRADATKMAAKVMGSPEFMETAKALKRISDGILYRETHDDMESYALERFGLSADMVQVAIQVATALEAAEDTDGLIIEGGQG